MPTFEWVRRPRLFYVTCSVSDVSTFWAKFYENNGMCLENKPFASYGQAVCGNGTCNGGK